MFVFWVDLDPLTKSFDKLTLSMYTSVYSGYVFTHLMELDKVVGFINLRQEKQGHILIISCV